MPPCNTLTCQIDGKANPVNPDGSPLTPSVLTSDSRCARTGRGGSRSGRSFGSSPRGPSTGRSTPFQPELPSTPSQVPLPVRQPASPTSQVFTPQHPPVASSVPAPSMDTSLVRVPVTPPGPPPGQTVGVVPTPMVPPKAPPPTSSMVPIPSPMPPAKVVVPVSTISVVTPTGPLRVPSMPAPTPSVPGLGDLCANPVLAGTELCRRAGDGTLNLSPECLAILRAALAAGQRVEDLRQNELCASFAELLVPAAVAALAPVAADKALADAAAVKSAGAVMDACYARFLTLPPAMQARVLEDGAHGAYGHCQQAAAAIRAGHPGAARAAVDWLYRSFPRNARPLADFCAAVVHAMPLRAAGAPAMHDPHGYVSPYMPPTRPSGARPSGDVATGLRTVAQPINPRVPTYSSRGWPRPAGDPPSDMTFTLAETPQPDPWAGLQGGGLGPAYNPTTGQRFDPTTGQPVGAATDYSQALTGLGTGLTTLIGGYLRGEQQLTLAQMQAQGQITAAQAAAQAARDVAEINAQRDITVAQLRGTTDPGAQAALQAQINALSAALTAAQSTAQSTAQSAAQSATTSNTPLIVGGVVVGALVLGGVAYALSGSGRKHNGARHARRHSRRGSRGYARAA